jgi:predicted PurR-regulated permease PerM
MTIWSNDNIRRVATVICLLGLAVVALCLCYLVARPFLGPVIIAVMLSVFFGPLHTRVQSLLQHRNLASTVSTILVFFVATIPLLLLGTAVSGELRAIAQALRESGPKGGLDPYLTHWRELLTQRLGNYWISASSIFTRRFCAGPNRQADTCFRSALLSLAIFFPLLSSLCIPSPRNPNWSQSMATTRQIDAPVREFSQGARDL